MSLSNSLFVLLLVSAFSSATGLKEFNFKIPPKSAQERKAKTECKFENLAVPENAAVYAAGAYSGRKTGFQIDQSGHETTQFDVAVNSQSRPVILMLGAYEPTIWNIGWSEGTEILAVLVSGYHRQVIAGLEEKIPRMISSYHNKGPCGYFYIKKVNSSLNPLSRRVFGKPVELVFLGDKTGSLVVGDTLSGSEKLLTSSHAPPESFNDREAPLAGKAGLMDAVRKGIIRRATKDDAVRWVEAVVANSPEADIPPVDGYGKPKPKPPSIHNAFVVLKQFTYPAGLYGAHSATFFIGYGVPKPQGDRGHSTEYDFNSLNCRGHICRR